MGAFDWIPGVKKARLEREAEEKRRQERIAAEERRYKRAQATLTAPRPSTPSADVVYRTNPVYDEPLLGYIPYPAPGQEETIIVETYVHHDPAPSNDYSAPSCDPSPSYDPGSSPSDSGPSSCDSGGDSGSSFSSD